MPTETRILSFTTPEIVAALSDFHMRRRKPIPSGKVLALTFTPPPDIHATIRILPDGAMEPTEITMNSEIVAAALVLYCMNSNIPLPARARKHLRLRSEFLELVFSHTPAA
ncbi:MAG: hypothetical protein PHS60_07075 [Zavarzinia sp.]|nr:hypothetical protein [Zavarzinia sp.]